MHTVGGSRKKILVKIDRYSSLGSTHTHSSSPVLSLAFHSIRWLVGETLHIIVTRTATPPFPVASPLSSFQICNLLACLVQVREISHQSCVPLPCQQVRQLSSLSFFFLTCLPYMINGTLPQHSTVDKHVQWAIASFFFLLLLLLIGLLGIKLKGKSSLMSNH